jgi:hypothetical protein
MDRMVAYCGLVCSDCPAYVATQANDQDGLERVAAQWREDYGAPGITVESVICDGCVTEGRKCAHCFECAIRACGMGRGVENCGHCEEYGCEKVAGLFAMAPDVKVVLDGVRAGLGR